MESTTRDLATLLKTGRRDVKVAAAASTAAYSAQLANADDIYGISGATNDVDAASRSAAAALIQALLLLVGDFADGLARSVLSALINLSEDERAAKLMCNAGACDVSMRSLLDPDVESRPFDSLHAGMLANLTRFDFGAKAILATEKTKDAQLMASWKLRALVKRICDEPAPAEGKFDPLESAAMIFGNISQTSVGREFLLEEDGFVLRQMVPWLLQTNRSRRLGVAMAFRNCALDESTHEFLLNDLHAVLLLVEPFIDPSHLPPADDFLKAPAATKAFLVNSERQHSEVESEVRQPLAEALLLLCRTITGRDAIRQAQIYPFLREAHSAEHVEAIQTTIEEVVQRTQLLTESAPAPVSPTTNPTEK